MNKPNYENCSHSGCPNLASYTYSGDGRPYCFEHVRALRKVDNDRAEAIQKQDQEFEKAKADAKSKADAIQNETRKLAEAKAKQEAIEYQKLLDPTKYCAYPGCPHRASYQSSCNGKYYCYEHVRNVKVKAEAQTETKENQRHEIDAIKVNADAQQQIAELSPPTNQSQFITIKGIPGKIVSIFKTYFDLKKTFAGETPSTHGVLVCQNSACREKYHLNKIITSSGDDVMEDLYRNAMVIGDSRALRAGPVMIGHSDYPTNKKDLKNLKKATKQGWTCRKCKADNSWDNSYSRA